MHFTEKISLLLTATNKTETKKFVLEHTRPKRLYSPLPRVYAPPASSFIKKKDGRQARPQTIDALIQWTGSEYVPASIIPQPIKTRPAPEPLFTQIRLRDGIYTCRIQNGRRVDGRLHSYEGCRTNGSLFLGLTNTSTFPNERTPFPRKNATARMAHHLYGDRLKRHSRQSSLPPEVRRTKFSTKCAHYDRFLNPKRRSSKKNTSKFLGSPTTRHINMTQPKRCKAYSSWPNPKRKPTSRYA